MEIRHVRAVPTTFETREDGSDKHITGYFSVFNDIYEIAPGMTESVAPGAFSNTLSGDVRALVNHDATLVLGRTSAHTLELREDSHGLWGDITVNPNDSDAMNLYSRVQRGDVSQCSFGFEVVKQDTEVRENGDVHWTIREVKLYEVSPCTFPAYESTNISARSAERDEIKARKQEAWRERMIKKLKGDQNNGTESTDAEKTD